MGLLELLYPLLSVPLLGLALRSWARYARSESWRWFALGLVLAAIGVDALRQLLWKVDLAPMWVTWAVWLLLVGMGTYVLVRTWRDLGRSCVRPRTGNSQP